MNVSSGGDFLPIVKYDARAGRMFRVDRDPISGEKTQVDITGPDLRFAIDFGSLQVGYVQFTANGPVRSMAPYGKPLPAQPQDKDDSGKLVSKPGFYVLIAGKGVGGIREWCSNAAILLGALDELYQGLRAVPGGTPGQDPADQHSAHHPGQERARRAVIHELQARVRHRWLGRSSG